MTSSFVSKYGSNAPANSTTYSALVGAMSSFNINEANIQTPVRDAGVFRNLYTYASANTKTNTATITFRKSTADTSITVSYTAGQTGVKEDTTNTATFATTDEASYKFVAASDGANSITLRNFSVQFDPTVTQSTVHFMGMSGGVLNLTVGGGSYTCSPNAITGTGSPEANVEVRMFETYVIKDLATYVSANARTDDVEMGPRINSQFVTPFVTYTAGQTGLKEDASSQDFIVAGDDYNYYISIPDAGDAGQITITNISMTLHSNTNSFQLVDARGSGTSSGPNLIPFFIGLSGGHNPFTTTEALAQQKPRFAMKLKFLCTYVSANTMTDAAPLSFFVRKNGSNTAMTVSYSTSQTGLKEDTLNVSDVVSTDLVNYSIVGPTAGTGTYTLRWATCTANVQGTTWDMVGNGGSVPAPRGP